MLYSISFIDAIAAAILAASADLTINSDSCVFSLLPPACASLEESERERARAREREKERRRGGLRKETKIGDSKKINTVRRAS